MGWWRPPTLGPVERVDRLERLTDLVLVLLREGPPRSLREIAEEVPGYPPPGEARRQAFERDKRTLRDEGIVVETEAVDGPDQVGYRIRPDTYYLADLALEPDEQAALNLAVAAVHFGEPIGRNALWRLGVASPSALQQLAALPALPALPQLFQALRDRATVTFDYRGEIRCVDPGRLRFRDGWWYLEGVDRDRGAPRTFRVDRMQGAPRLGAPGSAGSVGDLGDRLSTVEGPWQLGEGQPTEVLVALDRVAAGRVLPDLGDGVVVERRPDGSVVVRLSVTNVDALRTWVLEFGPRAEVLSPPEVRAALVAWLEAMLQPARAG